MTSNGWQTNWKAVAEPGAGRIDLRRGGAASLHRDSPQGGLGIGNEVVICTSAPGADRRCRRFAAGPAQKVSFLTASDLQPVSTGLATLRRKT